MSATAAPCLVVIQKTTTLPVTNHFTSGSTSLYKINSKFALLFRLYGGGRSCARCHVDINPTDLVMKARHCVFHVDCFKCATCDNSLRKGEQPSTNPNSAQRALTLCLFVGDLFGMYEDVLYCRLHFEMMTTSYGPGPDSLDMCPPLHSPGGKTALVLVSVG